MNPNETPVHVLRLREVKERTGLGTTSIYAKMERCEFPRPIPLGNRAVGWRSDDLAAWIEQQTAKRDASWKRLGDAAAKVVKPWCSDHIPSNGSKRLRADGAASLAAVFCRVTRAPACGNTRGRRKSGPVQIKRREGSRSALAA